MRLHIGTVRIFFIALFAIVALNGCDQSDEKFKSYSIGFTTQGQEVSVDAAHIDNLWAVPGGVSITGIWGEASGGASVFDKPMPHEIRINWLDKKTNSRYEANVKLVDDLAERARKLPRIHHDDPEIDQARKREEGANYNKGIDLIIGLSSKGKVTVWLSNYPHPHNISGRVLEVIGEAQGTLTNKIPSYYPPHK
jgi:hypothetical protein